MTDHIISSATHGQPSSECTGLTVCLHTDTVSHEFKLCERVCTECNFRIELRLVVTLSWQTRKSFISNIVDSGDQMFFYFVRSYFHSSLR